METTPAMIAIAVATVEMVLEFTHHLGVQCTLHCQSESARGMSGPTAFDKERTTVGRKPSNAAKESELAIRDMIRRWMALRPHRRTHFRRKRVLPGGSAL